MGPFEGATSWQSGYRELELPHLVKDLVLQVPGSSQAVSCERGTWRAEMVVGEGELSGSRSGGLRPPFLGLALKLWTILGISHSGRKIGHGDKDTVP